MQIILILFTIISFFFIVDFLLFYVFALTIVGIIESILLYLCIFFKKLFVNNYSWLQQRLHQLALSSKFMREVTFDVESSFISTKQDNHNHVFVAGLARSGTTILLNAIFKSNDFASLSYSDMPFILAPNLWSRYLLGRKIIILLKIQG